MGLTGWKHERVGHETDGEPSPFDIVPLPPAPAVGGFGVGEMPDEIHRFNWGAFFLTPLWGIAYASHKVVSWWVLSVLLTVLIVSGVGESTSTATLAIIASAVQVVTIGIRLWIGMNANQWSWSREQARLGVVKGAMPRFSVETFRAKQTKWLAAGIAITAMSLFSVVVLGLTTNPELVAVREQLSIRPIELAMTVGWTVAEIALALWLDAQMRKGRSALPAPTSTEL